MALFSLGNWVILTLWHKAGGLFGDRATLDDVGGGDSRMKRQERSKS